jgi:AraC family transcriptional regulator
LTERRHARRSERIKAETIAYGKAHFSAIAFIEEHLFEPMSVKTIAASSGFSPSRFSRRFTRVQGESVMEYVWGRRLEGAMRRILTDASVRIVDLAFDCGFDSQEAFTRAFTRAFGQTPGRLKRTGADRPLVRRRRSRTKKPVIHQSLVEQPEMHLAGLPKHFTYATYIEMGGLWQRIADLMGVDHETYGVFRKRYTADGSFDFLAAVRMEAGFAPRPEFELLTLPPHSYLVFRHMLEEDDLYPQMTAAHDTIWSEHLPQSGRVLADAPDFQRYPANFKIKDGWIEHYLPIEA